MRLKAMKYVELESSELHVTVPELAEAGGWAEIYGRRVPMHLEIGIGKDPHIIERALADPEGLYVGLEHSRKKLDKVLYKALQRDVSNLRLMRADASRVLEPLFRDGSLHTVFVFFPDPWPKKRHRKKRLIQPRFVRTLFTKMAPGARFELRTDDVDYREQMIEVLDADPGFTNELGPGEFALDPIGDEPHFATLFERKFREMGQPVHYMYYRRNS